MKKIVKLPLIALGGGVGAFVLLFTVYFFNLDMKFMAYIVDPVLQWWYDNKVEHKYYV